MADLSLDTLFTYQFSEIDFGKTAMQKSQFYIDHSINKILKWYFGYWVK